MYAKLQQLAKIAKKAWDASPSGGCDGLVEQIKPMGLDELVYPTPSIGLFTSRTR